jgi:hypothetical protein
MIVFTSAPKLATLIEPMEKVADKFDEEGAR